MKPIKIDIRYEDFNSEYHADVWVDVDSVEYFSSMTIDYLMEAITHAVRRESMK